MISNIRYIFKHLDEEVVEEIEYNNPGGLFKLCQIYTLSLQLEKEEYDGKQRETQRTDD
jgi:hypothetical protein|tara:strand:- start:898 stop:1074 length:177 start_codon:yes stop_codon:yes gene_type:complete